MSARYFASAGIRNVLGTNSSWNNLRHSPFIVLFGPSGQACQVPPPSGAADKFPGINGIYPLYGYTQSFNQKAIGSYKDELLISLQDSVRFFHYAFSPTKQTEGTKINDLNYTPFGNADLSNRVMFDGTYWKQISHKPFVKQTNMAYAPVGGALLWTASSLHYIAMQQYGFYKGDSPVFKLDSVARSGWWPRAGEMFTPGALADHNRTLGLTNAPGNIIAPDGTQITYVNNIAPEVCDIAFHNGVLYIVGQYWLYAMVPGGKGNFIFYDNADDSLVNDQTETEDYTERAQANVHGRMSRCFAKHRGELYMLSANGKIHKVTSARLISMADLTLIGTPWASGITYGSCPTMSTTWGGTSGRRCFMASFNGQLHAFLNFSTNWKVAKGTEGTAAGRGVFWATSHNGDIWSDRSTMLPSSGIFSPSGAGAALIPWYSTISPYKFSGRRNSSLTAFQIQASGGITENSTWGWKCLPSGLRQVGPVPFWLSDSTLEDAEGTSYNALNVPLSRGTVSGYLSPTWVVYPASYRTASGVFVAEGVGVSGYDYNGCGTYHISGHTDEEGDKLRLIFSQDISGRALYYELNRASGWIQKNYLPHVNQLNGFTPITWYDPDIIISSGTIYNPNPRVDEINKRVSIDFKVYDRSDWSPVKIIGEYSIDGYAWHEFGRLRNVSTGSQESDPSGVIGQQHTITWQYTDHLSKNQDYNNVQIRLRAEEI